ncbi:MAG: ABC transporter ATP-binding protein [Armatimonadota bacterium]
MQASAVEMVDITKSFPGILANDRVRFSAGWGEVHALIGENGAGKSTLMKVLYGMYKPDSGEIRVDGKTTVIASPHDAINLGIGMVHQKFMLVQAFTALENIILGMEPSRKGRIDYRSAESAIRDICTKLNLEIDLNSKVCDLSVSSQQKIEILKALYRRAHILILDEPSSILAPQEAENLFLMLRKMAREGMCVILISHKLSDVMKYTDRVTVMRQGRSIDSMRTGTTSAGQLARMMVGADTAEVYAGDRASTADHLPVLAVRDLVVTDNAGKRVVDSADFNIYSGEILGVAGVDGNGQRELAEALAGLRKASGSIRFGETELAGLSVRERLDCGIAYIPEDPVHAVVPDFTITENSILGSHGHPPFVSKGMIDGRAAESHAEEIIGEFNVKASGTDMPVRLLSGGNQQKLVLGRTLTRKPKLIIASQPTRGLDINAAADIHRRLLDAASPESGTGILLISYDLDEILAVSDRIMVMYKGRIVRILDRDQADRETIGALMLGARE